MRELGVAFGRKLKKVLRSPEGVKILDRHGLEMWNYGGCLGVAEALKKWLGERVELWAVVDGPDPMAHHVVAKIGDFYFDGHGAHTEAQIIREWDVEFFSNDTELIPLNHAKIHADTKCGLKAVNDLVRLFERRL